MNLRVVRRKIDLDPNFVEVSTPYKYTPMRARNASYLWRYGHLHSKKQRFLFGGRYSSGPQRLKYTDFCFNFGIFAFPLRHCAPLNRAWGHALCLMTDISFPHHVVQYGRPTHLWRGTATSAIRVTRDLALFSPTGGVQANRRRLA